MDRRLSEGNLLAGLLRGYGGEKMRQREDEREARKTKLQERLINLQMENAKSKNKLLDFQALVVDHYMKQQGVDQQATVTPPVTQDTTTTPMGESFQETQPELTDLLADPALLTAVGMGDLGRVVQSQQQFKTSEQRRSESEQWDRMMDLTNLQMKQQELESFEFTDPDTGVKTEQLRNKRTKQPVGPPREIDVPKPGSTETAGKLSLVIAAKRNIQPLKNALIKDGTVDRGLLAKVSSPFMFRFGGLGEGRNVLSLWKEAVDARVRAATGAAITSEEWPFYIQQYLPHPLDSDELVKSKLERLDKWIDDYTNVLDPGRIQRKRLEEEKPDPLGFR